MLGRLVGNWKPGRFPQWVTLAINLTLSWMMITRGWDYLRAATGYPGHWLSKLENTLPLDVWGALFITAGTLTLAGIGFRQGRLVLAGHLLACSLYFAVSTGQAQLAMENGWDGIRHATAMGGIALINLFFAVGTHMRLRQDEILRDREMDYAAGTNCGADR